jgi:pyruvate formate lyase activating enzyme
VRVFGKGFNFSQDGPGNRLVYHLSGCNMHCIWCSNPEGMDRDAGKDYTLQDLLSECISAKPMFFGGGGVTFTGGEATLQHKELLELLKLLQQNGIHTAIETNGTSARLQELSPFIDYLIMDYKHFDCDILRNYTGMDNKTINNNFALNCANRKQQHIRIPLINGFNADNPNGFVNFFCQFDIKNTVFEFLPYHEYGKDKWRTPYLVQNGFVTDDVLRQFQRTFISCGLQIVST